MLLGGFQRTDQTHVMCKESATGHMIHRFTRHASSQSLPQDDYLIQRTAPSEEQDTPDVDMGMSLSLQRTEG